MDKKQLFSIWAPKEGIQWTKFAKPALFMHNAETSVRRTFAASIPQSIQRLNGGDTAIIVDLPGASSVEAGLGLARSGFRPVPLYNGVYEKENGGLLHAVDSSAIINALAGGADALQHTNIADNAPPAFLLDAARDTEIFGADVYDNRWYLDFDDMPTADYLKSRGISKVLIWSEREMPGDLLPIVGSYQNAGIIIERYVNGQIKTENIAFIDTAPTKKPITSNIKDAVRVFENARFALFMAVLLAGVNLVGMFLVYEEPFLWTAPTIMWLTYLWVPEIVGDFIALALSVAYLVLYLTSHKKQRLIVAAVALFGLDVLVLFIYAMWYGLAAYTGYSSLYGAVVFVTPVVLLVMMAKGAKVYRQVENISEHDYITALDKIDGADGKSVPHLVRRPIFRPFRGANYRGYRGYGGSGRGGYGGGGYGGGFGG